MKCEMCNETKDLARVQYPVTGLPVQDVVLCTTHRTDLWEGGLRALCNAGKSWIIIGEPK